MYRGSSEQPQEQKNNTRLSDIYTNSQQVFSKGDTLDYDVSGGIFSILDPESGNHPKEEIPFLHRKRKRKRRYGRQM